MGIFVTRHYHEPIPAPEPERRNSKAAQARINGAKSRGPKTAEGKAKVAQNSRKHGITADNLLIYQKDEEKYNTFKAGLIRALKPQDEIEDEVVENIVKTAWVLRSTYNIETDMMRDNLEQGETVHQAFTNDIPSMMLISTYQCRLDRRFHRLLDKLRKLQDDAMDPQKGPVSLRMLQHPRHMPHPMRSYDDDDFPITNPSPTTEIDPHPTEQFEKANPPLNLNP